MLRVCVCFLLTNKSQKAPSLFDVLENLERGGGSGDCLGEIGERGGGGKDWGKQVFQQKAPALLMLSSTPVGSG
jgi:hypothetical protein